MKRKTVALIALLTTCAVTLHARVTVKDSGSWPDTWPRELDVHRKTSRTIEGPLGGWLRYEISFKTREDFEAAWPHLLKVRSQNHPITLVSSPHERSGAAKGRPMKAGVMIRSWPTAASKKGARPNRSNTTVLVLVVDGEIVDSNRLKIPKGVHLKDERQNKASR
jgi:hypothetical protein